jgi:hypothetical protein
MKHTSLAKRDAVSNKMKINLHVLRPLMLNWVGRHVHGTDIVAINNGGARRRVMKFLQ